MKAGWKNTKLKDVCELVNGRAYKKDELLTEGKYRVLRVGNFFTNEHWYFSNLELEDKKYCDKGDLLYAWSASFGPRIWSGEKVIFHYHIWKVLPNPSLIDQKFLFHFLMWDMDKIKEDQGAGTTMLHVSKGSMDERDISVPSIQEQQRIVTILDQAFEGIAKARANAEQNLQNARALFESHLQSVFTKIDNGKMQFGKALSDLCELIVDCEHKTAPTEQMGIPSIRTPNIGKGELLLDGVYRVSDETYKEWTKRAEPKAGDLILAREAPAGNVAVIPENTKLCLGQRTVLIRPIAEIFIADFLCFYLLQPEMQNKLLAHSRGATVQHVNMKDIRALIISSLPNLETQKLIVANIKIAKVKTQRLEALYQRKIELLDELKKSLLQQAFAGEL